MGGLPDLFRLDGRVAIITGGCGLLGRQHAAAIAAAGGIPVLADIAEGEWRADVSDPADIRRLLEKVLRRYGRVDILINNAANNPRVEAGTVPTWARFENFPLEQWNADVAVGLTGAFLCCQVIGSEMARHGKGVILNIASDLAVIAPDQRLYREGGLPDDKQPVKAVSYSVVKTALLGLTRYLATYWADRGVRVNAISPGGVYNGQPDEFVQRLSSLIPLGRMARVDEYQGAILFLCSDASSYMTGTNIVVDGGRSVW